MEMFLTNGLFQSGTSFFIPQQFIIGFTIMKYDTTAAITSPQQSTMGLNDHEAVNQFFEWPVITDHGAYQPLQYRTTGHLLASGVALDNIKAASLIVMCMLSARLGYPISAMLEPDETQRAIQLLDQCSRLVPSEAVIESPEFRPEHLYYDGGRHLADKCIISSTVNGFNKILRELELILTRGYATRQELVKGKYDVGLSEHRAKMQVSVIGINGGKSGKDLNLSSILRIPIRCSHAVVFPPASEVYEQYGLINSPLFKMRKTHHRLKWRLVDIPYAQQIASAMVEGGCDHIFEKLEIMKNLISIFAIMRQPPQVNMVELGAIIYGTDEEEVSRWLCDTGHEKDVESTPNQPIVATKIDYHLAHLLLDGILISGPNLFTDRQRKVFETVKRINMGKMSSMILKKGDDVETLAATTRNYGCWASREKVFEVINSSNNDFSLSSVSNDLVALLEMGVLERAKPPKSRFFGYYIIESALSGAVQLPAPETIQDPVYQGQPVDVINPFTGQVERI